MIKKINKKALFLSLLFTFVLILLFFLVDTTFAEKTIVSGVQDAVKLIYTPIYLLWLFFFGLFSGGRDSFDLSGPTETMAIVVIFLIPIIYFILADLFFYFVFTYLFKRKSKNE